MLFRLGILCSICIMLCLCGCKDNSRACSSSDSRESMTSDCSTSSKSSQAVNSSIKPAWENANNRDDRDDRTPSQSWTDNSIFQEK